MHWWHTHTKIIFNSTHDQFLEKSGGHPDQARRSVFFWTRHLVGWPSLLFDHGTCYGRWGKIRKLILCNHQMLQLYRSLWTNFQSWKIWWREPGKFQTSRSGSQRDPSLHCRLIYHCNLKNSFIIPNNSRNDSLILKETNFNCSFEYWVCLVCSKVWMEWLPSSSWDTPVTNDLRQLRQFAWTALTLNSVL